MDSRLPRGTETVLIVDDEPQIRTATARILDRLGYGVLQAGAPEEALQVASRSEFDLLLMDVVLPQMSGLALAHKISTLRPGIHILFFSAYASSEVLDDRLEERPGVGFIQKPFTTGEMARAVREVLDTRPSTAESPQQTPGGTETILVVDDDAQTQRFMTRALERLGYHVLEARDPDQAMTFAGNSRVSLAVLDVVMPIMTGPALARSVTKVNPRIRFLFVSGKAPEGLIQEQGTLGQGSDFMQKPFTAHELGVAVRRLLDS